MTRSLTIFLCCLAINLAGAATSLDLTQVPDKAKWVVHVDIAGFLGSGVGQWVKQKAALPDINAKLAALEAATRFDPFRDLQSITLGGATADDKTAVAYLRGTFDADHLTLLIKAIDGYEATMHGTAIIHSWPDEDGRNYGCFAKPDLIIMSRNLDSLVYAIDVVNGTAGNLAGNAELAKINAGSYFCLAVATDLPGLQGIDPQAKVLQHGLRHVQDIAIKIAEADGEVTATGTVTVDDEQAVELVHDVFKGLRAVVLLNVEALPPEVRLLAESIEVAREEQMISLALSLPVDQVIAILEKGPGPARRLRQAKP